jgi:HAD superfamily hydrolase (TIGR01549 family)
MPKKISNCSEFQELVSQTGVRAIAIDLRGTLTRPPRHQNLARAAIDVGIPEKLAYEVDRITPGQVKSAFRQHTRVRDWTLVSLLQFLLNLEDRGYSLDASKFDSMHSDIVDEYISESKALVSDSQFAYLIDGMRKQGVLCALASDGPSWREALMLNELFPSFGISGVKAFGSDSFGCNKLSPNYYRGLCAALGVQPNECLVLGDRMDKDIRSAVDAGCPVLFIAGPNVPTHEVNYAESLADICPAPTSRLANGVLFGRFQPFHNEHLRFVRHALERTELLTIGITQPMVALAPEDDKQRSSISSNPLPYWLRKRLIERVIEGEGIASNRIEITPVFLRPEALSVLFEPGTRVLVTDVEAWSSEKIKLIESASLEIVKLDVGEKTISGEMIRSAIRSGSGARSRWRSLLPSHLLDTDIEQIEKHVRRRSSI